MTVKTISWIDEDYLKHFKILIDNKLAVSAYPLSECPEDAILERDLKFVFNIPKLMQRAYDAGKSGESFVLTEEQGKEED